MDIPRNKPKEIVWDREWVAMHMEFTIPGITDEGFLAELKTMMIEVAGERLYDYRAVDALIRYMETRGFTCEFSDESSGRAAVYRWLAETVKQQWEILRDATDKWRKSAPAVADPNLNDPVLIQKLRARAGVVVDVGAELTAEQEATIRLVISERRAAREAHAKQRDRDWERNYAEDSEARHGIDTWTGDKWWEREMTPEELIEYRTDRERIEKLRFEALVEKERERYRKQEMRKKR